MSLVRLIILAALFYVTWRLVYRLVREKIKDELLRRHQAEHAVAEDSLVEDPVCRVLIPQKQAVRLRQNGRTYYFCSESCCDKFIGGAKG